MVQGYSTLPFFHAPQTRLFRCYINQVASNKTQGALKLIPRGKVGDTNDQAPAPAPTTRPPCAMRLKVRLPLVLNFAPRK